MRRRTILLALAIACACLSAACGDEERPGAANTANRAAATQTPDPTAPRALPDNGFKAEITLASPPARLRAGEKTTLQVRIRNASDAMWYARGAEVNTSPSNKFYLAAGDRWLSAGDEKLVTDMDGRYGLNRDLKPGEETELPLLITAPKEPGDYLLEVDLLQEQVAWFHEKGSPMARTKVTVVR